MEAMGIASEIALLIQTGEAAAGRSESKERGQQGERYERQLWQEADAVVTESLRAQAVLPLPEAAELAPLFGHPDRAALVGSAEHRFARRGEQDAALGQEQRQADVV